MEKEMNDILDLVTDYMTGEITPEAERQLLEWIEQSEDNRRLFVQWKDLWLGAIKPGNRRFDSNAAFQRFQQSHLSHEQKRQAQRQLRTSYIRVSDVWRWAAAICMPLLLACSIILYLQIHNLHFGLVALSTGEGEHSTILLPDSSVIDLDPNSFVRYQASDFVHGKRTVEFQGIAYFHIKHNPKHPFTINTYDERVRVFGTEFLFDSRPEDKLNIITLDNGCVEVFNKHTLRTDTIKAGDVITINKVTRKHYVRHRSDEEINLMAKSIASPIEAQPFVLEDFNKTKEGYDMKVVFNKTIQPGVYHVRMSGDKQDVTMRKSSPSQRSFHSGNGTAANPYVITTALQMCNMRSFLKSRELTYFALGADIDLKGIEWRPLNDFYDDYNHWINFDGRGHVIRNLSPTLSCFYSSFFGVLCGECRNVGFEDANISSTGMGAGILGGYIGHPSYPGLTVVENCYFVGRVSSKSYAGGIGGVVGGRAVIRNCCASVDVTSVSSYAGGLIGKVRAQLTMSNCYTDGDVAGQYAGGVIAGGQDKYTPASHYTDVIAAGKSVYGTVKASAFGLTLDKDTVTDAVYSNTTHVNGNLYPGGQPIDDLRRRTSAWPRCWYGNQFMMD